MTVGDIVKATTYLTRAEDIPAYAKVGTRFLGDNRPPFMLLIVPQLVRPRVPARCRNCCRQDLGLLNVVWRCPAVRPVEPARCETITKGSELLVAALENEGVDRVFGIPGEENLAFLEALRTSKIELVLTRHEQAAAFMAATQGRLIGQPGVCLSTLGPGALNLATGAA